MVGFMRTKREKRVYQLRMWLERDNHLIGLLEEDEKDSRRTDEEIAILKSAIEIIEKQRNENAVELGGLL